MLEARISPAYRGRVLTASSHPNASNRTKYDNERHWILLILLSYFWDPLDCLLIGDQKARSYIHTCIMITQVEVCVWTPPRLLKKMICLHLQNLHLSLSKCEIGTVGKRFGRHAVWFQHQTGSVSVDIHVIMSYDEHNQSECLFGIWYLDKIFWSLVLWLRNHEKTYVYSFSPR